MNKNLIVLFASLLSVSTGCARQLKVSHLGEPADPTGDDPKYQLTVENDDVLPGLLQNTVLHYAFDDATLSGADMNKLRKLGEVLKDRPWASIRIAGHADDRGTEEYNLALGQRRADSARSYLLALGVRDDVVESISFGDLSPIDPNSHEDAWAENRRSEFGPAPLELFGYLEDPSATPLIEVLR